MQKKFIILLATFLVVLTAGVAAAQVANPDGSSVFSLFRLDTTEPTKDTVDKTVDKAVTDTTRGLFDIDGPLDDPAKNDPVKEEPTEEPEKKPEVDTVKDDTEKDEPADEVDKVRDTDTTPPMLRIASPEDGAKFDDEFVVFRGVTEPGATVHAGDWKADVDAEGHWAIKLRLNPGRNRAAFVATDQAGNKSEASITVVYVVRKVKFTAHQKYEASDAEIPGNRYYGTAFRVTISDANGRSKVFEFTNPERDVVAFTANQKYGSCAEEVPYDVFWGTGKPGSTVWVGSPYGGATTTVSEEGHWEIRVEFAEAPAGKTFEIVIEGEGGRKVFKFTNNRE